MPSGGRLLALISGGGRLGLGRAQFVLGDRADYVAPQVFESNFFIFRRFRLLNTPERRAHEFGEVRDIPVFHTRMDAER